MKTTTILATLALALTAGIALADSPHFVRSDAAIDGAGDMVVSFKLAGLGANVTTTIAISADATVVYGCRTHGGNFPSAANKQELAGPVSASGDFTSGKNGQITGSLSAAPPAASLVCPHGQAITVCSATYADIVLDGGVAGTVSLGTLSDTPFLECL